MLDQNGTWVGYHPSTTAPAWPRTSACACITVTSMDTSTATTEARCCLLQLCPSPATSWAVRGGFMARTMSAVRGPLKSATSSAVAVGWGGRGVQQS